MVLHAGQRVFETTDRLAEVGIRLFPIDFRTAKNCQLWVGPCVGRKGCVDKGYKYLSGGNVGDFDALLHKGRPHIPLWD